MGLKQFSDKRGVSSTIAVVLLVAIVVIMSAVVGTFALNSNLMPNQPATTSSFSVDVQDTRATITVDATTSNTTLDILVNGHKFDTWQNVSAGEGQELRCLREGDTVTIVERKAGSESSYVTKEYTIPSGADPPSTCPRHAVYLDQHPAASTFVDLTGWGTSGGGDREIINFENAYEGSTVMKVDPQASSKWSGAYTYTNESGEMDLEPGQTYTVSAWVYIPEDADLSEDMEFHPRVSSNVDPDAGNHEYTMIEQDRMITSSDPRGEWVYKYYVYEVNEDIEDPYARLSVLSSSPAGADGPIYVDAVKVAKGDRVVTEDELE